MSPGPGMDETINNRAGGINEFEESKAEVNKHTDFSFISSITSSSTVLSYSLDFVASKRGTYSV